MRTPTVIPILVPTAPATDMSPAHQLFPRQSSNGCESFEKVCGEYCIDLSYICCPDRQGGCAIGDVCDLGDNGKYGCCRIGHVCSGNGGSIVIPDSSIPTPDVTIKTSSTAPTAVAGTGPNAFGTAANTGANIVCGAGSVLGMLGGLVASLLMAQ